jgi:hypothetical protein
LAVVSLHLVGLGVGDRRFVADRRAVNERRVCDREPALDVGVGIRPVVGVGVVEALQEVVDRDAEGDLGVEVSEGAFPEPQIVARLGS